MTAYEEDDADDDREKVEEEKEDDNDEWAHGVTLCMMCCTIVQQHSGFG